MRVVLFAVPGLLQGELPKEKHGVRPLHSLGGRLFDGWRFPPRVESALARIPPTTAIQAQPDQPNGEQGECGRLRNGVQLVGTENQLGIVEQCCPKLTVL